MKHRTFPMLRLLMIAGLSVAVSASITEAAQAKSGHACRKDWRAHKAMYQSEGKTRKSFIRECRAGTTGTAAPQPKPQPSAPSGTRTQ